MKENLRVPINKGNYSMDTKIRERMFDKNRGHDYKKRYKFYRKMWSKLPQNYKVSEYPLEVGLELSSVCNLRCPFCYTITDKFQSNIKNKFMKKELAKNIIDEVAGKTYSIRLSYRGEPTLYPYLVNIIKYAKAKGINEVSFLTNGSKLEPHYFEKLLLAGVDWITVSFDGIKKEYEKNRYPLKFNDTLKKLKEIKIIKEKYNKVKPVIKVQTVWPAIKNNPTEYYKTLSKYTDLIAFNPLIDFENEEYNSEKYLEDFSCPMLYQRIFVHSDGYVVPCCGSPNENLIIGDANKESIYDIWHSEKLNYIRNKHKKKTEYKKIDVCKTCFLARKTREEKHTIDGRVVIVKKYI
ncbi:MAG: radical SAM/SPASM domain-containing protein [Halanaerobiales bacterium]